MATLAFLADVHVKRGYALAIRSNGFQMVWSDDETYDPRIDDADLLDWGLRDDLVIVTNDADFVELATTTDHAGIIMYQQYGHPPGTFAPSERKSSNQTASRAMSIISSLGIPI